MHGVAKQGRQTLNDGEPEPEAVTSLASDIAELMIFAEDGLKIMLGYADAGIPDLDAQSSAATTAAEQYSATPRIFQSV